MLKNALHTSKLSQVLVLALICVHEGGMRMWTLWKNAKCSVALKSTGDASEINSCVIV